MADLEKVKKGLDLCLTGEPARCKDCPYDTECKEARGIGPSPLRRDALELLKNEPLPVLNVGKCGIYFGDCPHCGKRVTKKNTSYCPYCGRRVKWDG